MHCIVTLKTHWRRWRCNKVLAWGSFPLHTERANLEAPVLHAASPGLLLSRNPWTAPRSCSYVGFGRRPFCSKLAIEKPHTEDGRGFSGSTGGTSDGVGAPSPLIYVMAGPSLSSLQGVGFGSARAWQQCHAEQDSWQTLRLRALNAVERVVRLGQFPKVAEQWPSVSLHAER